MTDPVLQAVADYMREQNLAVPPGQPVSVGSYWDPTDGLHLYLCVESGDWVVPTATVRLSYGGLLDLLSYVYTEGKLSEMRL